MRIVLTNDDGVGAPGLHALARACCDGAHDVLVVAPREDVSGSAAAIGRIRTDQRIATHRVELPGCPQVPAHAIDGPPGLAAMAACLGGFGELPDAIVSGINAGPNTGHAILHSGTVGAALTAATFGVSALALSADVAELIRFDTACGFLEPALEILEAWPVGTVLNVNVPALADEDVRGLRWARLDRFGSVRVAVAQAGDRWLQMEYRATDSHLDPDSDTALLAQGFATITAIEGIAEVSPDEVPRSGASRDEVQVHVTEVHRHATR